MNLVLWFIYFPIVETQPAQGNPQAQTEQQGHWRATGIDSDRQWQTVTDREFHTYSICEISPAWDYLGFRFNCFNSKKSVENKDAVW